MAKSIYIYDPTASDKRSAVRGVGRYMQLLKETVGDRAEFVGELSTIPTDVTFLNPFFNPFMPPLSWKKMGKRQGAVIHDLIPLKFSNHFPIGLRGNLNIFFNKLLLKNFDFFITDSQNSKNDLEQILKIPSSLIFVIYPYFSEKLQKNPTAELAQQYAPNEPSPTSTIYVGDTTWNKNVVNIAKALKLARVDCTFVGNVFTTLPDPSDPWKAEFNEFKKITANDPLFHFPGFVSDDKLADLYKSSKVNLLLSREEGFGFSYLEAATYKTPSVLADRPIFHEIAQDTALFADPENVEDIADKIHELLDDDLKRIELGKKAQERSTFFSKEKFEKELMDVLTK